MLWWRRAHPVPVALLLLPIALVTDFVGGAVLVAVYTVVLRKDWLLGTTVAGLHAAATAAQLAIRPDPQWSYASGLALSVLLLGLAVGLGAMKRARHDTVDELRDRAARAERDASAHAEEVRAQERTEIAREMHDVLAHRISMVSLYAGALELRADLPADEVARAAGTIRAAAHQALEDLHQVLGALRAEGAGLVPQPRLAELDASWSMRPACRSPCTTG